MTATILFASKSERWDTYVVPLRRALDAVGVTHRLGTAFPPEEVDYIVYAPNSGIEDFTPFTRLKAVLSLWAGVEAVIANPTLRVPLARMVDPGLTRGMTEWVVGHTLRHHLGMDTHILGQDGVWREAPPPPLARDRRVSILGLGALGAAAGAALAGLGFPVTGWSRSAKTIEGLEALTGEDGLQEALARADILILLLPDTPATKNILNPARIERMPKGAVVINPGRGSLIDGGALMAGLDDGHLAHATLDVFRTEPLPPDHPFWAHPKITVTPHIASQTRAETAVEVIAENVRRGEAGETLLHLADRDLGY